MSGKIAVEEAGPPRPRLRESLSFGTRTRVLARLHDAKIATAADKDLLAGTSKHDMKSFRVLGEGAFGLVDLVLIETHEQLLLSVRKKLLKQGDRNVNDPDTEVQFLQLFNSSPFIAQLWTHVVGMCDYTLLLEYCPYGSLDKLLQVVCEMRSRPGGSMCLSWFSDRVLGRERNCGFTENETRFYIGCCILGLEKMHQEGILHRDLKPSNLLVGENKYVKLGDLGLCKRLDAHGKAHAHAGTPGYMAPEILHDKTSAGYGLPADMWSLGIMIWELVDGLPPRWAPMSWYFTPSLHFPPSFSKELCCLLSGLLEKDPSKRLQLTAVKSHPWYDGFDWDELAAQSMPAPDFPELAMVHIHAHLLPRRSGQHARKDKPAAVPQTIPELETMPSHPAPGALASRASAHSPAPPKELRGLASHASAPMPVGSFTPSIQARVIQARLNHNPNTATVTPFVDVIGAGSVDDAAVCQAKTVSPPAAAAVAAAAMAHGTFFAKAAPHESWALPTQT